MCNLEAGLCNLEAGLCNCEAGRVGRKYAVLCNFEAGRFSGDPKKMVKVRQVCVIVRQVR